MRSRSRELLDSVLDDDEEAIDLDKIQSRAKTEEGIDVDVFRKKEALIPYKNRVKHAFVSAAVTC
jgi:hypothetical protein